LRFRAAELLGFTHNVAQPAKQFTLLSDEQLRIADDVYEQDMRDFELNFLLNLGGHPLKLHENKAIVIRLPADRRE
jgi:hypothetical protein